MTDPKHQAFLEDLMAVFVKYGMQITSMDPIYADEIKEGVIGAYIGRGGEMGFIELRHGDWLAKKFLADPENTAAFKIPQTAHERLAWLAGQRREASDGDA